LGHCGRFYTFTPNQACAHRLNIARRADPKDHRVKLGMTRKFLPFKYFGATGSQQAYGFKEE
jgi:hypothetical protein